VTTKMFDDITEASYARIFRYSLPGRDNRYIMLLMGNNQGTRRIYLSWSRDGRIWDSRRAPLIDPPPGTGRVDPDLPPAQCALPPRRPGVDLPGNDPMLFAASGAGCVSQTVPERPTPTGYRRPGSGSRSSAGPLVRLPASPGGRGFSPSLVRAVGLADLSFPAWV